MRTAVLAVVAVVLTVATPGGAWVGAAAFSAALIAETILVVRARAGADDAYHPVAAEGVAPAATDDRMLRFSTPLMVNVLLWWSTPLLITSVLARSPFPAEAIAAFVVVEAVAWFLAAPVGQFQFVSIGLVDCRRAHRAVQRWSLLLAMAVAVLVAGTLRKFLDLLGTEPRPATAAEVDITFDPSSTLTAPTPIPRGTRLIARDPATSEEFYFETWTYTRPGTLDP